MNSGQFKQAMHSINYGHVMQAAAEDYAREMKMSEREAKARAKAAGVVDARELCEDPDLEEIHRERVQAMKEAQERRMKMEREGHGTLSEVEEKEFLPEVTTTQLVVAHFYHQEFERCRIMDKHLSALSKKYFDTKFIKISAPDAPFFVTKLQVKVLPCLIFFKNGVAFDRLVGFEDLGGKDDYPTAKLERILLDAGAVVPVERNDSDSEDEAEEIRREAMNRMIRGGYHRNDDDEDSDFE
ncbi:thioredoxin-like protein [Ostreococcus tauri]|nr:thioredoxin-like protein [Ostreococcus tauri]